MPRKTGIVYEVRSEGKVLAQFESEAKAKKEMRRARKEGSEARVYSKWVPVKQVRVPKRPKGKAKTTKRKATETKRLDPETRINGWLTSQRLEPVPKDMTFQQLYEAIIVDLKTLEEAVGECSGRKSRLVDGIVEAMDHPAITRRFVEGILEDTMRRRRKDGLAERWIASMGWEVSAEAAEELSCYWQSLNEPFFLAAFRNGRPCDPEHRDSDLSVQPTASGLALCYREVADEKVYFVLKDIDWMELREDRLLIFGSLKDGSRAVRTFPLSRPESRTRRDDGCGIAMGWYRVGEGILVHIEASKTALKPEDAGRYDRYLECTAVYPYFDSFILQSGRVGVKDGTTVEDLMEENMESRICERIPVEDPRGLKDAFERRDMGYISKALRSYPRLDVFGVA